MIRKLSLAALVAVSALALGGCVSDYAYRDGPGDYYYGSPSTEYYYDGYGAPYGSIGYGGGGYYGGYGYGSYGYGGYGYPGYYGGGYYGGYGYPYGYGYYRGHGHSDRPDRPHGNDGLPYYNKNVHGSDKIPGILSRNPPSRDNAGQGRAIRDPSPSGLRYSPPRQQESLRSSPSVPRGRVMRRDPTSSVQQPVSVPRGRAMEARSEPIRSAPAFSRPAPRGVSSPAPRVQGRDIGRKQER